MAAQGRAGKASAGGTPSRKPRAAQRKGFLLRLPPKLLAEMKRWAADDLRSVNGQIEYLLTDALRRRRGKS